MIGIAVGADLGALQRLGVRHGRPDSAGVAAPAADGAVEIGFRHRRIGGAWRHLTVRQGCRQRRDDGVVALMGDAAMVSLDSQNRQGGGNGKCKECLVHEVHLISVDVPPIAGGMYFPRITV